MSGHYLFVTLFAVTTLFPLASLAADLNILWVNDEGNKVAKDSVETALQHVQKTASMGTTLKTTEAIDSEQSDVYAAIEQVCGKLETMIDANTPPDLILDTSRAGVLSEVVKSLSLTLGIPTVSMSYGEDGDLREWRGLTSQQANYLVQIRPPGDVITSVIRQLVSRQNITNAAILFDDSFVMDHKYKSLLQNLPVRHVIHMIKGTDSEVKKQLMKLDDVDLNNFFVLGSQKSISRVLDVANGLKLYGSKYAWFTLTKDAESTLECRSCNHPTMFMYPMAKGNDESVKTIRRNYGLETKPDVDVAFYFDTTLMALKAVSSMKDTNVWPTLEYTKCNDYTETEPIARGNINLLQTLKSTKVPLSFGPISITSNGNSAMQFDVNVNMLQFRAGSIVKNEAIGTWMVGEPDNFKLKAGQSLAGYAARTQYKVVTVVQPPFIVKEVGKDGKVTYKGYCIDLLEALSKLMNFDYMIYESPDGQYGRMTPDLQWNGVVKELVDRNADMAIGALSVMAERETVVDFTVPYYDLVGITIMMKKPKVPTSLFKFLSVLEDSVWGCILAAYFFTSVLMWIFDYMSPYSYQNNMEKYKDDEEKRFFNFKECLWFCMTSLTPQGGGEAPKNLSGRLVAATWWLFGFIIIASYTANLAAFLTVSRLETPVESLEDLSKQYKIQYSPMNNSATMVYFERMAYIEEKFYEIWKDMSLNDSTDEYERSKLAVWDYPVSDKYTKMWQSMREAGLPSNFEEAIARVRTSPSSSEGYAFLGDATDIRYQVLTNCDLQMVGEEFSRKPYALAVQQGSPLKDQLNDAILKLLNQRKLETFKERWWNQNPEKKTCEDEDEDSGGGISIYNIGGVFIVIFVGIGLAIITLVFEFWYYRYKKPQSRVATGEKKAKQLQVKQQVLSSSFPNEKTDYGAEFRGAAATANSNVPPVGNPW